MIFLITSGNSLLFWINPCNFFFLEEPSIGWDGRVYDGEKCFWSGADVSLSIYINIKILFLEQNFNVYVSTGNLFSEKQCWPAEGGFPKPIALCIPRLCPWFHSKYCTRGYQRRNKGGTKINTFFYFLHILSISGYATFIIIHKSSCGCVLW